MKRKKIYVPLLNLAILFFHALSTNTTSDSIATTLTNRLYGKIGANISRIQQMDVTNALTIIIKSSYYQQLEVCPVVLENLNNQLQKINNEISSLKKTKKAPSQKLYYRKCILEKQITHITNFFTIPPKKRTTFERLETQLTLWYEKAKHALFLFFHKKEHDESIDNLSRAIISYIAIERNAILFDSGKLTDFLMALNDTNDSGDAETLPTIINFWSDKSLQKILKQRAHAINPKVKVQLIAEIIFSMAAQGAIMAGGQLNDQWIDAADAEEYKSLEGKQNKISAGWRNFQQGETTKKETFLKALSNSFTTSQKAVQNEYKQSRKRSQEESLYLNQSINLATPIQRSLTNPIQLDQLFSAARMLTPSNGIAWYNVFKVDKADWEFDENSNSFWQNGMTAMPKIPYWQKIKEKKQAYIQTDDPGSNAIFSEWYTGKIPYEIEIECQLVASSYPFFAGVCFNRGRWISGDDERLWWYRLVGLYGTEITQNKKTTQAINLSFAQLKIIFPQTAKQSKQVISPLEQIMANKTKPINFALPSADVASLKANPQTYVFDITNKPNSVILTFSKKEGSTKKQLYTQRLNNLAEFIYKFHGIGFIASGCQAEFRIVKPKEFVFTAEQISTFKKTIQALLKKYD